MSREDQESLDEQKRKNKTRELALEVLEKNPELAQALIAGNPAAVSLMEQQLKTTPEAEFFQNLPNTKDDVPKDSSGKSQQTTPTFEDLRRNVSPEIFKDFVLAVAKITEDDFYVTVHQPYSTNKTCLRLWTQSPDPANAGHPDWMQNHERAVLEAWGGKKITKETIEALKRELLLSERARGGGEFSPRYVEYKMHRKQEKV